MIYCNRLIKRVLGLGIGLILVFCLHGLLPESVHSQVAHSQTDSVSYTCPVTSSNATELIEQGTASYQQGQFNAALDCWQQGAKVARSRGNTSQRLISEINQAQALQALGLHLRACQTLLATLGVQEQTCLSLTETDLPKFSLLSLQSHQPEVGITVYQTGLRSLGDVLRSLGNLDLSQQLLSQLIQAQPLPSSAKSAAILSLGKTNHAFSKRYQELYHRSGDIKDAIAALTQAEAANEAYQQVIQQPHAAFSAIQAQLNQLNLSLALSRWMPVVQQPVDQQIAQTQFTSVRRRDGQRECQENTKQQTNSATSTWERFQHLKVAVVQSQPPLTTLISGLQHQIADSPAHNTSSLYARLNFAHLVSQLQTMLQEAANSKRLELEATVLPSRVAIAQELAQVAQAARHQGDGQTEAYALGYLGRLYLQTPNPQLAEAQDLTLKALTLARTTHIPELIYQWEAQLGNIYQERAHQDPALVKFAIGMYSSAIETLKSVRSDLLAVDPDIQFTFRDSVEPTYRNLIDILLTSNPASQPQPELLKRALETIDALQKAELENFLQCSLQAVNSRFNPFKVETVAPVEQAQVATIYPILLKNRLEIVVKLPTGELRRASTPVGQQTLEQTVKALRPLLTRRDADLQPLTQLAKDLYTWLIQPIEHYLDPATIKTLVFVPDSLLRNIPMAVLYHQPAGSGQGRYLIQDYAISVSPGLNLPPSQGITLNSLRVLMVGLSEKRTLAIQDQCTTFDDLPSVKTELEAILGVLRPVLQKERVSQLLNQVPGQEFTKEHFRQRLESSAYPIVHLATHGKFSSNPRETYILTAAGDPLYVNDLQDILRSRVGRTPNAIELLVLSACETAAGDNRAALGIAGVAVRSGASSTLASLWTVDDASTAQLMKDFYTQLVNPGNTHAKLSKAEALRQAQVKLLETSEPDYRHPSYWAPFILVGNWQ